jgi:hypothetical protein
MEPRGTTHARAGEQPGLVAMAAGGDALVVESWAAAVDLVHGLRIEWNWGRWGVGEEGGGPGLGGTGRRRRGAAGEGRNGGSAGRIESGEGSHRGGESGNGG